MADYKVVNATQLDADMASVADTIRTKGGTTEELAWPEGFKSAIEGIKGAAPAAVMEKDVNFYDYDGTCLYAYTLAEAQALTELPPAPMPPEEFLYFQEWNWTLEQIKTWGRPADVGAIYATNDEKTYLRIKIPEGLPLEVPLYYYTSGGAYTSVIDWGDGNVESITGYSIATSHEYAAPGDYLISFNASDSGYLGHNSGLLGTGIARTYLRKAYIREKCGDYTFKGCCNLEVVIISHSTTVTSFLVGIFADCRRLKHLNIPSQMTGASDDLVRRAYGLRLVSMPFGFISWGWAAFMDTRALHRLIVPNLTTFGHQTFQDSGMTEFMVSESLTNIPAWMFAYCSVLQRLKFYSKTPPTVANANAFTSIPATCIVEVPADSLEAYQNATNYGNIAAQMVGV